MGNMVTGHVSKGSWFREGCWDGDSHLLPAVGLARVLCAWHNWGALSIGKRMAAVFVRHEFCLCGICDLPALSSTSLPPLETYVSESQASPLSDLWLISVLAERLSQARVLSCPFFKSLCAFHYSNELHTA